MSSKKRLFKIDFNSPVILGFSLVCFVAVILGYITNDSSTRLIFSVYGSSFADPMTYFRLIGHVFGHANWEHFIGNIMLVLVVGPLLEEKYGSLNILYVILSTAVITGLVHVVLFPEYLLLGASGVVFALILLSSFTCIKEGSIPLTFILVTVLYIGEQIYSGIAVRDNVSNLTHIIGGIVGASLGYVLNRRKKK